MSLEHPFDPVYTIQRALSGEHVLQRLLGKLKNKPVALLSILAFGQADGY